jgi:hypothetical protein
MPGQRKAGKRQFALWLSEEEMSRLRVEAARTRSTMGDVLKRAIPAPKNAKKPLK